LITFEFFQKRDYYGEDKITFLELFNFQRDIEWLDDGADVYEAKMEEMNQK
jgi:uncharacterized protein (DUF2461 family)